VESVAALRLPWKPWSPGKVEGASRGVSINGNTDIRYVSCVMQVTKEISKNLQKKL
jgi:hypothetical protein